MSKVQAEIEATWARRKEREGWVSTCTPDGPCAPCPSCPTYRNWHPVTYRNTEGVVACYRHLPPEPDQHKEASDG